MILTDKQKAEADRLLLTYTDMGVALRTHIVPEVHARRKQELLAERDAWEAKIEDMKPRFARSRRPLGRPWQ